MIADPETAVYLLVTLEQAWELSVGRVPDLVRDMARWAVEDVQIALNTNRRKPDQRRTRKKKAAA